MATITISSKPYEGDDDCLSAAAADTAEEYDLEGWDLDARWGDGDRKTIELTTPDWAANAPITFREEV